MTYIRTGFKMKRGFRMKEEYYEIEILCRNCNSDVFLKIPKGTTKEDYLNNHKICDECGCKHGVEK